MRPRVLWTLAYMPYMALMYNVVYLPYICLWMFTTNLWLVTQTIAQLIQAAVGEVMTPDNPMIWSNYVKRHEQHYDYL